MSIIKFNTIRFNTLDSNIIPFNGVHKYGSYIGVPPIIPDIPEEPDVPSDPDVDENGYIIFADPEVKRVLLANGVGDGVGITKEAAAEVTDMTNTFYKNTEIVRFDELEKFTSLTSLGIKVAAPTNYGTFSGCANLQSVKLPSSTRTLGSFAFQNCTALTSVGDLSSIETFGQDVFYKTTNLNIVVHLPNLKSWTARAVFYQSGIVGVTSLGEVNLGGAWNNGIFQNCKNLKYVILPPSVTTISGYDFNGCIALQTMVLKNETPPTLSSLPNSSTLVYVPDASVSAYREASGWSGYASRIFSISQLSSDNPDLYNEIKDYL